MSTSTDLQTLIDAGQSVVANAQQASTSTNPANIALKSKLSSNAIALQNLLDNVLQKGGILTAEDTNALDEQIRITKLQTLQAESINANQKYAIYVVVGLSVVALVWYYIYKKK